MEKVVLYPENLHNIGDLVLLFQTYERLRCIKKIERAEFYVYSWGFIDAAIGERLKRKGVKIVYGKNILRVFPLLRNSLHVWGGGQLVRNNSSIISLLYFFVIVLLVRAAKGKFVVLGCGISTIDAPRRLLYRSIFHFVDIFSVRDETSLSRAQQIVEKSKCFLTADLAFADGALHKMLTPISSKKIVIIAPCQDKRENRHINARGIAKILNLSPSRHEDEIILLCHDVRSGADPEICADLAKEIRSVGLNSRTISTLEIDEIASLYRMSRLVITNRLHACIFGILSLSKVVVYNDGNKKTMDLARKLKLPFISADVKLCGQEKDMRRIITGNGSQFVDVDVIGQFKNASEQNFTFVHRLIESHCRK